MVTCLSVLTSLKHLSLTFLPPRSRPEIVTRPQPQLTHTILPHLTHLHFKGVTEYFEDLVARIDVPMLEDISIRFFNQLLFDIFHLPEFLRRTVKFTAHDQANVIFRTNSITFALPQTLRTVGPILNLEILCSKSDWQLSSLLQVCHSCLHVLSNLERLEIGEDQDSPPDWQDDIENTQWVELLQPFATVKELYLPDDVASRVAPALQELSEEQATEVLPALQNLFCHVLQPSRPFREAIEKFSAVRELSGHPVAIYPIPFSDQAFQVSTSADATTSLHCPSCGKLFSRRQERDRHVKSYLPNSLFCPFAHCSWRGDRVNTLKTHWRTTHPYFGEGPRPEDCRIYDPDPLVRGVAGRELTIEHARMIALQVVKLRAPELGKLGIWNGEWGRRIRPLHP